MKYTFLIDRGIHEYVKKHGGGCMSVFIYCALNHYLDYLEHVDANTLLDEIVKINLINLNDHNTKTTSCRITRGQFERLTALKKYTLQLSKLVNRALQFYIEKVYGLRLNLEAIGYKHGNSYMIEVGEESLKKINTLKRGGELEKAIKSYIEYFEGLDAMGKLDEISKINSITGIGTEKQLRLYGMGIPDLKRLCEKYGLKVKYVLMRVVEWYMGR